MPAHKKFRSCIKTARNLALTRPVLCAEGNEERTNEQRPRFVGDINPTQPLC